MKLYVLAFLAAFAVGAHAEPSTLKIDCQVPGFGLNFNFTGKLKVSDPNHHLEQYTMEGPIHFEDAHRPDLEFTDFQAFGEFDMSRGVIRFRLRPIAPILFNAFENIRLVQETNGHQVIGIESGDLQNGPNGGTSGHLCDIQVF